MQEDMSDSGLPTLSLTWVGRQFKDNDNIPASQGQQIPEYYLLHMQWG